MKPTAMIAAIAALTLAGSAHASDWDVISRYLTLDGKEQFVFTKQTTGIGYSEAEQTRRAAAGELPPRDGAFAASYADCSTKKVRCISLDDLFVFAVDVDAFLHEKPYEIRGTKFVPSCSSATRPPKCGIGTVQFSNARTQGFFLVSLKDGILMIGLNPVAENELEFVYLLETGMPGLLHQ